MYVIMTTSETGERIFQKDQHGTHSSYVTGCRCDLCRRARSDYMRQWRAARASGKPRRVHNCPCCSCERPGGVA